MYYVVKKTYGSLNIYFNEGDVARYEGGSLYSVKDRNHFWSDRNLNIILVPGVENTIVLLSGYDRWLKLIPVEGTYWKYKDGTLARIDKVNRKDSFALTAYLHDKRYVTSAIELFFEKWKYIDSEVKC